MNLEYLNLETKTSLEGISNHISVIYDILLLHSKVSITEYRTLLENLKQNHLEVTPGITRIFQGAKAITAGYSTATKRGSSS